MAILNKVSKKRDYLQWVLCCWLFMVSAAGFTQEIEAENNEKEIGSIESIYLKATSISDVTYLTWQVKGQEAFDVFLVQHSTDGHNFETIDFKDALGCIPGLLLSYTYIIKYSNPDCKWYRVRNIGMGQDIVISNTAEVTTIGLASEPIE